MITVSPEFTAAQESDSVQYASQIYLILSNYAASGLGAVATASDSDASGDYPPAGAIDGDRTEINVGATSAADNGVGKSSWKSLTAPDGSGSTWLKVAFGTTRTFNRVKLYNRAADPLTSYLLQYWNGSAWVDFAGTPDRFPYPGGGGGFGEGPFGYGPFGGTTPPGGGYTGGLDFFDLPAEISSTEIRCVVYSTTSGGVAQIVELEVYRRIDITSRVIGFNIDRRKDMKQKQPIATQLGMTLDNTDRFFSISYSPTAAEIAAGYVNSELGQLGVDIEVNEGFYTTIGPEYIRTFTGSVDSLTPKISSAQVALVARDPLKHLIDIPDDSSALKTAIDITDAIRYLLNRVNVSNYEMSLFTSGITLDIFFTYNTGVLTSIQQLTQAAGDAMFYFDETGKATFEFYLSNTYNSFTGAGRTYFLTGTLVNIDAYGNPGWFQRQWFLIDDFADGDYTVNPVWTPRNSGVTWDASANYLKGTVTNAAGNSYLTTPFNKAYGTFRFLMKCGESGTQAELVFISQDTNRSSNGYTIWLSAANVLILYKTDSDGTYTQLINTGIAPTVNTWYDIVVVRDSTGLFTLYVDGVSKGTYTENTHKTSAAIKVQSLSSNTRTFFIDEIYYSPNTDPAVITFSPTNVQGVWTSPTIDQGASVTTEGVFTAVDSAPVGTSISYYTRTSTDGLSWDAWVSITSGNVIASAVKRYLQVKAVLNCPQDDGLHNTDTTTPSVSQFIVSWYFGTGQNKWRSSVSFSLNYNDSIIDLQEQVSDTLGGDTAVINHETVSTSPLILAGDDTDTVWQSTTGSPAAAVSAANPLVVSAGTYTYNLDISGMDISKMTGSGAIGTGFTGPACVVCVGGTATGTAAITYVHPSHPVLTLTITGPGTITDFRVIGKTYKNNDTPYQASASDAASITLHKRRSSTLTNNYIVNANIAQLVANKIIANQKDAPKWIPEMPCVPKLNAQPGDQVQITELQSGLSHAGYYIIGYSRTMRVSGDGATAQMTMALMNIPV